ncbi:MAG: glycosyltransferase family 2 protein [Patescibacteria group bacterium]
MLKGKTISVVIPVFNEKKTLKPVVETVLGCSFVDRVIAINDGSTDQSLVILKSFGKKIKLLSWPDNKGKGYGLAEGVLAATSEIIVFLDADLIGLNIKHIRELALPIATGQFSFLLATIGKKPKVINTKVLTGQRAYRRKDLLPLAEGFRYSRYGVEVFLNHAFSSQRKNRIHWSDVNHLHQHQKNPPQQAFETYLMGSLEIIMEYARVNNLISPELEEKIGNIAQSKNLRELKVRIKKIKNKGLKSVLEEFISGYSQKIRTLLK